MRDLRDVSKLPADPDYWVELEARTVRQWDSGKVGQQDGSGWWGPIATRAVALSGLAAAAGIAALLLVPPRTRGETPTTALLYRLPDDPAMNAFLASPAPPSLGSLLSGYPRSTP
jgi:hypothetical protein